MKILFPSILLPILLTGCVNYANIEQTRMGMTVDELLAIDTPCYYRGESENQVTYNCQFSVPTSRYTTDRTVKPYILTFENGKLTEIKVNEQELDRRMLRDGFYGPYPYGYYFHYGYPYYYP